MRNGHQKNGHGDHVKSETPLPIHGERGLLIKDEKDRNTLVISDVHIGFEEELIRGGVYIPNQMKGLITRVRDIIQENHIERVVINGDLKHRVPSTKFEYRKKKLDDLEAVNEGEENDFQTKLEDIMERMKKAGPEDRKMLQVEFEEMERKKSTYYRKKRKRTFDILEKSELELKNVALFLRTLLDDGIVDVVPGNHDGRIQKEIQSEYHDLASDPGLRFHTSKGIVVGSCGLFHGHAWPSEEVMSRDYLIMGHGHAAILLTDGLGVRNWEPCWLRTSLLDAVHERYLDAHGEVVLMPSFNDFFRGSAVNGGRRLLGPLFKNDYVDVLNGEVYLLDGVHLGKVSALREFARRGRDSWI